MFILVYTVLTIVFFATAKASSLMNFEIEKFTRDPAILFDYHPLVGSISYLGILFWSATAAVCFFAAKVLSYNGSKKASLFLTASGLFTVSLMLDDLFMVHDWLGPVYLQIHEVVFYLFYLLVMVLYIALFWRTILQTEFIFFLAAGMFFALSMGGDVVLPQESLGYFIEDCLKFTGIVTWFIYFTRTSLTWLKPQPHQ